ncbi:MAG TPA: PilZ domain-containing protein [Terriglobales bacterium]
MKTPISLQRADKRIRVALPVRIRYTTSDGKPAITMACTYDISPRGARIAAGGHSLKVGEQVAIERGRNKFSCRIVWVGDAETGRSGLVGIEYAEKGKGMWDGELKELGGMYDTVARSAEPPNGFREGNQRERRHHPRVSLETPDQVLKAESGQIYTVGCLQDLSESGCRIVSTRPLPRGSSVELTLKLAGCELTFNGRVRRASDLVLGIEFEEARKGDREILRALLIKLQDHQIEESFELEVSS